MDGRPDILLIMCDQLNARFLGCYGAPWPTPHIDRLAAEGVRFTQATCPWPVCSPSRASLLTGLYPHGHGICHNVMRRDYPSVRSAPDQEGIRADDRTTELLLATSGYETWHAGKWHLSDEDLWYYPEMFREHIEYGSRMSGYFARIRARPRADWLDWYGWALPVEVGPAVRAARERGALGERGPLGEFLAKTGRLLMAPEDIYDVQVAERTAQRLRRPGAAPRMLTCSLNFPHDPYVVPSPYYEALSAEDIPWPASWSVREARFEADAARRAVLLLGEDGTREFLRVYAAKVRLVDDLVGRVLEALEASGRGDRTVVVFTSDHGDMAGGHGMITKSTGSFYEEVVRVPLLVRWPGHVRVGESAAAASLVDLMPTLLELTGHAVPAGLHGRSLVPDLRAGGDRNGPPYAFCERLPSTGRRRRGVPAGGSFMVRGQGWKYVRQRDGGESLYHLAEDPGEVVDLAGDPGAQAIQGEMHAALAEWLAATGAGPGQPGG